MYIESEVDDLLHKQVLLVFGSWCRVPIWDTQISGPWMGKQKLIMGSGSESQMWCYPRIHAAAFDPGSFACGRISLARSGGRSKRCLPTY